MKKYYAYVRVSTVKQGDGVSLEAQREAIELFAAKNNLVITKWFEEKATAAKSGRLQFSKMLRELKAGRANGVLMHKIDRSARNYSDWYKISELADKGIEIHFVTESLDFQSRGGRLTADIQAVIATDYIRNLREETIKGMRGRLKQGLYPFAAPIGYLDMGGGKPKALDPLRADLVRKLFELYATGEYPLWALVREMKKRGLVNKNGKPLSKTGIESTLSNPFYCGIIRVKRSGETFKGIHHPLISSSLFLQVQDVRAGKSGKKITKHNHLYRGLFKCGSCGYSMTPERQRGKVYYRCHTSECKTKSVRESHLEEASILALSKLRFDDQQVARIEAEIERWRHNPKGHMHLAKLKGEKSRVQTQLQTLEEKLISNVIDDATYLRLKEKNMLDQKDIEEKIIEFEKSADATAKAKQFFERAKTLCFQYIYSNPDEKRRLIKLFTSNRIVSSKNIEIELQNWLIQVVDHVNFLCGAPASPASRTKDAVSEILEIMDRNEDLIR